MLPDLLVGRQFDADLFAQLPAGLIYRGNRTSTYTSPAATQQNGVLRIDNMTLKAGRVYYAQTGQFRITGTNVGDRWKVDLRFNSAGTAVVGSAEIGRTEEVYDSATTAGGAQNNVTGTTVAGLMLPTSDTTTASILLTAGRAIANGAGGTIAIAGDTGGLHLLVWDLGVDPTDTGIDL